MATMRGYTLREVANKVGVSTATIVRWMDTKKVSVKKKKNTRGHYFFTEADLQRFTEFHTRIIAT